MTTKAVHMEATFGTSRYDAAMKHMRSTTKSTTAVISSAWVKAAGSVYAAMQAWDMLKMGAKAQQQAQAFANMAASYGANSDLIISKLRQVSAGTIDTMTMIEKAGTAMMMGIRPEELVKLMEIARATAKLTGQTVTKAFEDISLAVGRQSRMILDNLGIIVKQGEANEKYAKFLGKTASKLTDAEKKQAFMNATIEAGAELMDRIGAKTRSAAEIFQSFEAVVKHVWVGISKFLADVLRWFAMAISKLQGLFYDFMADSVDYASKFVGILSKIPGAKTLQLDDLSVELKNIGDQFKYAADQGHNFASELWNINDVPAVTPFMPTGGGAGGDDSGSPETSYLDKMLWHDASQITDMWLAFDQGRQDAHERGLDMISQMDQTHYEQENQAMLDHFTLQGEMLQLSYGEKELLRWTHNEKMAELQRQYEQQVTTSNQRIAQMEQQIAQVRLQIAASLANTMLSMAGADQKALFLVSKAFAMAQAIMATHMSIAQALAVPPVPNVALGAVAAKLGYSQVALIAATTIGGLLTGGGGGSGGGGGTNSTSYPEVTPPEIIDPNQNKGSITFNIHGDIVKDDQWIDSIVERINDAGDREVFVNWANGAGELTN